MGVNFFYLLVSVPVVMSVPMVMSVPVSMVMSVPMYVPMSVVVSVTVSVSMCLFRGWQVGLGGPFAGPVVHLMSAMGVGVATVGVSMATTATVM